MRVTVRRFLVWISTARPVLIIYVVATLAIGHDIRTDANALPFPQMWWGIFVLAAFACAAAAVGTTKLTLGFAGAVTIMVFTSRAVAVIVDAMLHSPPNVRQPVLAISVWGLLAFLSALTFRSIVSQQE